MKKIISISLLTLLASLLFFRCSQSSLSIGEALKLKEPAGFKDGRIPPAAGEELSSSRLSLQWEFDAHASFENSSVVCADNIIFFSVLSGRVYALDLITGDEIGMLKYDGHILAAPLVNDSLVVSAVIPRDKMHTMLIYHNFVENTEQSVIRLEGKISNELLPVNGGIAAVSEKGTVYLLDWEGSVRWKRELRNFVYADPLHHKEQLVIGTDEGILYRLSAADGSIISTDSLGVPVKGIAAAFDGIAVSTEYEVVCISDAGERTYLSFDGILEMEPLLHGNTGYIGSTSGEIVCFDCNGSRIWGIESKGLYNARPLLLGEMLIQPDAFGGLHIYDKSDGSLLSEYEYEGKMRLSPLFYKGYLFIGFDRGIIYAYRFVD